MPLSPLVPEPPLLRRARWLTPLSLDQKALTSSSPVSTTITRPLPPSGREPDHSKKEYCTYWIRTGECDFTQQGCLFKHEMPDLKTLREKIGISSVPHWYQVKTAIQRRKQMDLDAAGDSAGKGVGETPRWLKDIVRKNARKLDAVSESGSSDGDIAQQLPAQRDNVAYIGPVPTRAAQLGIHSERVNPKGVIDFLHYHRSIKTDYELACMREAQKLAVAGHRAAKEAFFSGMSEFDINLAYLTATGHRDTDVPYGNIIALNEHAAVLHYTRLDHQPPAKRHSFLIDAGAEYLGYAADLTRSYAAQSKSLFLFKFLLGNGACLS